MRKKKIIRVGNLILTTLAIGRVTLTNAAKNLQFVLAQDIFTLAWVSGRVLISTPDYQLHDAVSQPHDPSEVYNNKKE